MCRVRLNIWDIGGQATLRPYWQNYYERTDALLWVVDSSDVGRLEICRDELHGLLKEEKLVGATLLILANKQDLQGALPATKIKQVQCHAHPIHLKRHESPMGLLKVEKPVRTTLLILANKQGLQGALPATKIKQGQHKCAFMSKHINRPQTWGPGC